MRYFIMTIGVSGSGKTTWAEKYVEDTVVYRQVLVANINRDDCRREIFFQKTGDNDFMWNKWNRKWEKDAYKLWVSKLDAAIADPTIEEIISSDTNLNPETRLFLEKKFAEAGFVIVREHFPITYEVAVKQDLMRKCSVGSVVIAEQIERYWAQFEQQYVPDRTKPKAVIVDVDGTLALSPQRSVYDYTRVILDSPNHFVVEVVKGLISSGINIIILSGRDDYCLADTSEWLIMNNIFFEMVLMRKTGDKRPDQEVKKELFFNHVADHYNVLGVIDDRPKVVRLWRSMGLPTLAVGFQSKEF